MYNKHNNFRKVVKMKNSIPFYQTRNISSMKELLNGSCELYGDNTACLVKKQKGGEYTKISYHELKKDVDALGSRLIDMGLSGCKIAIIGENLYEWLISYLAIVNGVGIAVPLDKELSVEEQQNLIERAEVTAIIYADSFSANYTSMPIPYKINMHNQDLQNHSL